MTKIGDAPYKIETDESGVKPIFNESDIKGI